MSAFNTPKTTALAPMASVSVKTAVMVKPGDLRSWRRANRRSCSRVVMVGLRVTVGLYGRAIGDLSRICILLVTVRHNLSARGGSLPFTTVWFLVMDG